MARFVALVRPVAFASTGALARGTDLAAVEQSIVELLSTLPGELEMEPTWGSLVRLRLHEPNDAVLAQDLRADTAEAIARWEKRVRLVDTAVSRTGHRTELRARFVLVGTRPPVEGLAVATFTGA